MGKEDIELMRELHRKYFHQIVNVEKGEKLTFPNRAELVKFVAFYFTSKYCIDLMYSKSEVRKNQKKLQVWNSMIEREIAPIYEAFKLYIYNQCEKYDKKRKSFFSKIGIKNYHIIKIDSDIHSEIYHYVLNVMEMEMIPQNTFPIQNTYYIDLLQMTFSQK